MKQSDIFLKSEGDAWFTRNEKALSAQGDLPLQLLALYDITPKRVLEIGCSNGYRLHAIQQRYGASCTGIEPSKKAIEDGKARFQGVRFIHGDSSHIPLQETFDLIIIHFVLHWVDRDRIASTFTEVDRLLAKGGLLMVGDFFPDEPTANAYHHLKDADVKTFKDDYAARLIERFGYLHIMHATSSHSTKHLVIEPISNDRISISLLYKR